MEFDDLSRNVLDAAIEVHKTLGPGLFEETYKICLRHELTSKGMKVDAEVPLPVEYKGIRLESGYRVDLVVENALFVELKAVKEIKPIHKTQLLTYLRLAKKEVGLLLNFNTYRLKDGITRIVNNYSPSRSSRSSRFNNHSFDY